MSITLSQQQGEALSAVEDWLKTPQQVFRLYGGAGTGKTTIAKWIATMVNNCAYATFTGKAAHVLQQKGCYPASTIHSAIYRAHQDLVTGKWHFGLNHDSFVRDLDLLIVDEVSMVGVDMGLDLLKLAKKILVLGDSGQLPPIKSEGFFMSDAPDFELTEIHRQALDNPIIAMAKIVRDGGVLKLGSYGESRVMKAKQFDPHMMLDVDQVLVGKNDTRCYMNQQYRKHKGYEDMSEYVPVTGEKLICLRNNHERGFLNGQMYSAVEANHDKLDVEVSIVPWETPDGVVDKIYTPMEYFQGKEHELDFNIRRSCDEFTYAYTVTVHKSQGSQWNSVIVLDQSKVFREYAKNHLYTAITRAAEKVTVFI